MQQYILIDLLQSTSIGGVYTVDFTKLTLFEVDATRADFLLHEGSIGLKQFVGVRGITALQTYRDVARSRSYTEVTGRRGIVEAKVVAREVEA